MPKRRLSKQQRSRIEDRTLAQSASRDASAVETRPGTIVAHHGKLIEVLPGELFTDSGTTSQRTVRSHLRANLPLLVCGDQVLWRSEEDAGEEIAVIEQLLERKTLLSRPRPYTDPKPVAANIDLIVLVISAAPAPISSLIDRYLIAAEQMGVEIAIAINKVDLLESPELSDSQSVDEITELAELYHALGYSVFALSATSANLQADASGATHIPHARPASELLDLMSNCTSILVGQSGVGKSSLLNAIAGENQALVGDISSSNAKGKHTTTNSTLYLLQADSPGEQSRKTLAIIDSPGIREFGLWHLSESDIISGMREFSELAMQCQFRDCDHKQSRGCAVQAALESGRIHPKRASSYRSIMDSLDNQ